MSGIAGIWTRDGRSIDRSVLEQMADSLAYRGPDAQATWTERPMGLVHTLLRTTREAEWEHQPATLDDEVWITADARVDGRDELRLALETAGERDLDAATDPELLLHAYRAWGEGCVERVIGDFAFAIWDTRRETLFCARDHFGVKPFYYSLTDDTFLFSNTLDTLLLLPAVSDRMHDPAVADFLLFGFNQDLGTTTYADIRRLPPAHALTCSAAGLRLRRYWTLPTDGQVAFRRESEYVEQFARRWRAAVRDRLRTPRVGVLMSGGLDSTAVAATAHAVLGEEGSPCVLRAYTQAYERLLPDEEPHYAGLVASALGMPHHVIPFDDYQLYERWGDPELRMPEPHDGALLAGLVDLHRLVQRHQPVLLTGYGADALLHPSAFYFIELLRGGRLGRFLGDAFRQVRRGRRVAVPLRSYWRECRSQRAPALPLPPWLEEGLAERLGLKGRWERYHARRPAVHPTRPKAYNCLLDPVWPFLFEFHDPATTGFPIEPRHPFFDVRLVTFALALPPVPWCEDKAILREALRGLLPEPVRCRPKTPLARDDVAERLRRPEAEWVDRFVPEPELERYVTRARIPPIARPDGEEVPGDYALHLRPLSLNEWFRYPSRIPLNRGGVHR